MAQLVFSIIIPCYNQAQYLPDCLESILMQDFRDWEAIVVNDGSSDNTEDLANGYHQRDNRIRLYTKNNGGLSSARNAGIREAKGERYLFLDADDFLKDGCLRKIAETLQSADAFTWIQYGYTYMAEDKSKELHSILPAKRDSFFPSIFSGSPGPCHSICISKELCSATGWFDESLKSVEDWDFWTRAAKAGAKQIIIPESLVFYRYAQNSMSRNGFVMYDALKKVISRGPKKDDRVSIFSTMNKNYDFDINPVLQEMLMRCLGVCIMQGKIEDSIRLFLRESPTPPEDFRPESFRGMCSYLSFRYWYSAADIKYVMNDVYPNFDVFFKKLGYSNSFRRKALFEIFKQHRFHHNNNRWGMTMGKLVNKLLRLTHLFLLV